MQTVLESFIEMLEEDQDYLPAILGLATAYMIDKEQHKAKNLLKRIAKLEPYKHNMEDFAKASLLHARLNIEKGRYDVAQEAIRDVLASNRSSSAAWELMGLVMEKEQDEKAIFDMAGSGFASTVRLAKSSPSMWTPIFEQNQENILEVLDEYITNLKEFKSLMEQKDYKTVFKKIQETNAIREILAGIN